jgi:peroxiredoxin
VRRRLLTVSALGVLAVAALVGSAALGGGGRAGGGPPAPALPRTVLVPPRATLAALRGKPAIVHFWASWCGPCTREAASLARLAGELHGRARLVGISWSDSLPGARAFVRRHRWTFPNLRDADGRVGNRYGLQGLPTTYVLDSRGRIVKRLLGPQTADGLLREIGKLT